MKAVNLIPQKERRGGSAASRSGGGAYFVLGTLAALVLMMAVYALEGGKIGTKRAEAVETNRQAEVLEAKAASMSQYTSFAELKNKRIDTVAGIAESRFDWSNTLHDLARVIPPNTWLTSLTGTVDPSVTVEGGSAGGPVRAAITSPAIEMTGCTTSQPAVARMMAKMRNLDDVVRVTLTSSEKNEQASGDAGAGGDCRGGSDQYPKFSIVIFFEPMPGQGAAPAPAATPSTPSTGAGQ